VPDDVEAIKYSEKFKMSIDLKLLLVDSPNVNIRRNYGIKNCEHRYIVVLDDDVELDPQTLIHGLYLLKKNPRIAAVCFPTLTNHPKMHEKIHFGRFIGGVYGINTVLPCTIYRKHVLDEVGLYREDMGPPDTIHEDWELGSRIRKHGYKIVIDGTITQKHLIPKRKEYHVKIKYGRNMFIDYIKAYYEKHWWSVVKVLKSSPASQYIEYILYFLAPLLFLLLLFINPIYSGIYLLGVVLCIFGWSLLYKRYYRFYPLQQKILYTLMLYSIRILRIYVVLSRLMANILTKIWS